MISESAKRGGPAHFCPWPCSHSAQWGSSCRWVCSDCWASKNYYCNWNGKAFHQISQMNPALYSSVLLDPTLVKEKIRGWDSLFSSVLLAGRLKADYNLKLHETLSRITEEICSIPGNWIRSLKSKPISRAGHQPCSHCESWKGIHLSSLDLFSCLLWAQWKGHTPWLPRCLWLGLAVLNLLGSPSAPTWLMPGSVDLGAAGCGDSRSQLSRRDMRTAMFSKSQLFVCVFVFLCIWISLIFLNIQRA